MSVSSVVQADRIGVNFVGGSIFNGTPMAANEVAGFIPQQSWNNAIGTKGSIGLEGDGDGSMATYYSGFNLTWDSLNIGATSISDTSGNQRLMKGFLLALGVSTPGQLKVTVFGVPSQFTTSGYAVIVYYDGISQSGYQVDAFTIDAPAYGSRTIYGLDQGTVDFLDQFQQIPSSSTADLGAATPAGNFTVFGGMSDSGFTLTVTSASGGTAAVLNGLQIVDVHSLPAPPIPVITSTSTATGIVNQAFSYAITANNSPDRFGASGLPTGLSIDPTNGVISGTPSVPGTYDVMLSATNTGGIGTAPLTLLIGTGFSSGSVKTGTTNHLSGGSLIDIDHGLIVGDNGTFLVTTNGGQAWGLVSVSLTNSFLSVRGIGSYEFVSGTDGLIALSRDFGLTWTTLPTGVTNTIYSLSFLAPFWGYAVGSGGLICFWDGAQWITQPSGVRADFYSVTTIGTTAYAVGAAGTICRFNGVSWTVLPISATATFYGVDFLNDDFGYAVGSGGAIYQTADGGAHWIALNSGTRSTLRGISIVDLNTAWICGDNGVILQTTDGGAHWISIAMDLLVNWSTIDFHNGRGLVVGDSGTTYLFQQASYALNHAPLVSILAPGDGAGYFPCSKIPIYASAHDVDGFVSKVELFLGPVKLAESAGNSLGVVWTNRTLGTFTCVAKATDNLGATAFSAPVNLTISLAAADQLRALGMVSSNAFEFCLCGLAGQIYTVENSNDLADWVSWRTVTNQTGVVPMVDERIENVEKRFYRAHRP